MRQFLAKRWFLLALVAGVLWAVAFPGAPGPAVRLLPPQAVVALALFLMAWGLESRSLGRSLLRPLPALWATAISYGAAPLLAWLCAWLLPVPPDFRVGLVIIASVPCTLASAVLWTRMAGGNEAVALLTVLLTTATSWLVTPLWLAPLAGATPLSIDTARMMRELLLFLVLPVVLGQALRAAPVLARAALRLRPVLSVVAQLLILAIILKAAVSLGERLQERSAVVAPGPLLLIAAACVAPHLGALFTGLVTSRALRFDRPTRIAVAFACSQKTLPVALLLFESYFKQEYPLAVLPLVFYHVGQLAVDTLVADRLRERGPAAKPVTPDAV
jgi:solute carrier family 10 (sodium/bile acid cotransporter), member 7